MKPTTKKKKRLVVKTITVAETAKQTIERLDAQIEQRKAQRVAFQSEERKTPPLPLFDDKGAALKNAVHAATQGGVCWRPDLFLANRSCDLCRLYPYCLAPIKRLKIPGSQRADQNPREQQAEMEERVTVQIVKKTPLENPGKSRQIVLKTPTPRKKLQVKAASGKPGISLAAFRAKFLK